MSELSGVRGSVANIRAGISRVPDVYWVELVEQVGEGRFTAVVEGGELEAIRQEIDELKPAGIAYEVIKWPARGQPASAVQRPPWWRRLWTSVSRWAGRTLVRLRLV